MKTDKILKELDEVIQDFIEHQDNQSETKFCKNVDKLINLKNDILVASGSEKIESNCAIPVVVFSEERTEVCPDCKSQYWYTCVNGSKYCEDCGRDWQT